jgi:hypothetical protein
MLCKLESAPALEVFRNGKIRDGPVVPASLTEIVIDIRLDQPVADTVVSVSTGPPPAFDLRWRRECRHCAEIRRIAEKAAADLAFLVLEIDGISAAVALEKSHEIIPNTWRGS